MHHGRMQEKYDVEREFLSARVSLVFISFPRDVTCSVIGREAGG